MKHRLLLGGVLLLALSMLLLLSGMVFAADTSNYVGSGTCKGCHFDLHDSWSHTIHGIAIRDAQDPENLFVDPLTVPSDNPSVVDMYFRARFVYTTGSGTQRFIWRSQDGNYYWLPATYDKALGWQGDPNNIGSLRAWAAGEGSCAGCHTTAYDPETNTWAETSITCEACHGPGAAHVKAGGDPDLIEKVTDPEACASCHEDRGSYVSWEVSLHAQALPDLKASGHASDRCAECHSSDAIYDGKTLETAQKSITCSVCHDAHPTDGTEEHEALLKKDGLETCAQCHNAELEATSFTPGSTVHHPMKEMFEGYGAIGVSGLSNFHYNLGVTCVDCHAVYTDTVNGVSLGSHGGTDHQFLPVLPGDAAAEGLSEDSCTSCHAHENSSREVRQSYVDFWQGQTTQLLDEIHGLLDEANPYYNSASRDLKLKYDSAFTNVSFVEADGSTGVHNFEYTQRVLRYSKGLLQEFLNAVK